MNKFERLYSEKLKTPEEIATLVKDGYLCVAPSCMGEPMAILDALGERAKKGEIKGVVHHSILAPRHLDCMDKELSENFSHITWFSGAASRKGMQEGYIDYLPCHYSYVPSIWRDEMPDADVFYAMVSPMDKHGFFTFGLTAAEIEAIMERSKHIYLEVNDKMPRVMGSHIVHISEVDAVCEASSDLIELPAVKIGENDKKMGQFMAELIPDGATLQFGIGGVPSAVGQFLMDKKDLGIHTELFVDSMIDLIEAGVVTNRRKNIDNGKSVATFAWGSKRMYDFLDNNISMDFRPVDYVNSPYVIGQLDNFISVNSCLEIDIIGQVCSESIGPKPFSGSGGQVDFVRGCHLSKGGKSFIAMNSTAKNDTISKIKPILTPGAVVTTGKNDVDYVVTEYGVVKLKGKTASQRVKSLISIAHPKFRDELTYEAKKLNYII